MMTPRDSDIIWPGSFGVESSTSNDLKFFGCPNFIHFHLSDMNCFRIIYNFVKVAMVVFFLIYCSGYCQVEIHQWRRSCFWCQCWICWIWLIYWKYTLHIEYWGLIFRTKSFPLSANQNIRPIRVLRVFTQSLTNENAWFCSWSNKIVIKNPRQQRKKLLLSLHNLFQVYQIWTP